MIRFLGICLGILALIAIGYPFGQDVYHRYLVSQRLDSVMDSKDRAAFRQWNGSAIDFAKTLYERCELNEGKGAVQCERYRYAFE